MYTILEDFSDRNISAVPDAVSDHATAMGMMKIFCFAKKLRSNSAQAGAPLSEGLSETSSSDSS